MYLKKQVKPTFYDSLKPNIILLNKWKKQNKTKKHTNNPV